MENAAEQIPAQSSDTGVAEAVPKKPGLFNPNPVAPVEVEEATKPAGKKKGKKEEVEGPPPVKGLMVHTDGSAAPTNPGFAGWGMHGYLYEEVESTKGSGNPDYVLTANDYMTKTDKAINALVPLITPVYYVDGYGSLPPMSSNNAAELSGALAAFRLALEHGVQKLRMWSDSKYVIGGLTYATKWRANNWLKQDGEPPANVDLWKQVLPLYEQLQANGVDIQVNWCKGHNGNFGNEMADHLAWIGHRHAVNGLLQSDVKLTPAQGYWKYDTERHPFINHRRMYYNSDVEYLKPGEYYFGEHDSDDDLAGKRMANGCYALVRMVNPDPTLELVRNHSCALANGENSIMLARLEYLYRSDIHGMLTNYGTVPLRLFKPERPEKLDIVVREDEPLVRHYNPPLLIQRTINAVSELGEILDHYLTRPEEVVTTDITSLIYESVVETSKKVETHVTRLRPEFKVGISELATVVNYRHPEGDVRQTELKLILGLDLLDRNALRRLEEKEPSVTLVTWLEEPSAFRYAVIVKCDDAIGIWGATYSNLHLIPPSVG